jgi:uncharacterized membrane protein HdeD (DUF308 family)
MNDLAPLAHPGFDLFLLGFIVAASFVAVFFFLRFWKETRDPLFLWFAVFFGVQSFSHSAMMSLRHPNEGAWWLFVLRLLSVLGVLGAILWKNRRER